MLIYSIYDILKIRFTYIILLHYNIIYNVTYIKYYINLSSRALNTL